MARFKLPEPVLLVVAAFSRHLEALSWVQPRLEAAFGPVALASAAFSFHHTRYYQATMGEGLRKQFLAFRDLIEPDRLADIKQFTINLEAELAEGNLFPDVRPLNLDPGLLSLGKFMLASTKDQAQRIYLHDGIFAEVTLHYKAGQFEPWPWTYADYREAEVQAFLQEARAYYFTRVRA